MNDAVFSLCRLGSSVFYLFRLGSSYILASTSFSFSWTLIEGSKCSQDVHMHGGGLSQYGI
jgi:hypothetical protein